MDTVLRQLPAEPFLVAGQYARYDPSRQPAGAETMSDYTHVPQDVEGDAGDDELTGDWDDPREREVFADRMERQVEGVAPGFRELAHGPVAPGAAPGRPAPLSPSRGPTGRTRGDSA